ncbi:MAG: signal peptidase I [Candidatus Dojkabacteria bacterium]
MNNPFAHHTDKTAATANSSSKSTQLALDAMMGIGVFAALLVVCYLLFVTPNQVDGSSMFPNLENDEVLLTNRIIQNFGGTGSLVSSYDYQRGDIVVFHDEILDRDLVKRVIGLEGDSVRIEGGRVYVNNLLMIEDYIDLANYPTETDTFMEEGETVIVPENSYFLLGDNRPGSKDSRNATIGFVTREELRGAPFLRVFPLDKFSYIGRGEWELIQSN